MEERSMSTLTDEQIKVAQDALRQLGMDEEHVQRATLMLETDDEWDPYLHNIEAVPEGISGGRRCGVHCSTDADASKPAEAGAEELFEAGWWVGYSPRNGLNASVEGSWLDWVFLARRILRVQAAREVRARAVEE